MKRIVLIVFLVLAGLGGYFLVELGAFQDIELKTAEAGPFKMIYKEHVGPYHKIGDIIHGLQTELLKSNIPCDGFGEFLDDPSKVEHVRLRSNAGCIVKEPIDITAMGLGEDVKFKILEPRMYIIGDFNGSPALGPYKVYDLIASQLYTEKLVLDGANIEIYHDLPGGMVRTEYLFPVKSKADK